MSIEQTVIRRTDDGIGYLNVGGFETSVAEQAANKVGRELATWLNDIRMRPNFYNRVAYQMPETPYAQMLTAKRAVENDDIVSGVCDVSEALMLQGVKWESEDELASDIFNQIARDLNFDEFVREWHREEFTHSQVVVGLWWGTKEYTPRTTTDQGKKSKRKITLHVPLAWTFLDPHKVVPLKPGPFGQDRLAWHATPEEFAMVAAGVDAYYADAVMQEFTTGPIKLQDKEEIEYLERIGINTKYLLGLNPSSVFRSCRTKMSYERFSAVRLKSVFPLLDLKQQLIESDRVSLVGAANFILLVRQGSDHLPAKQVEIDNLKENFKMVAKLPVVVGDHRLSIEIVTPNQEHVLDTAKYDTIDKKILNRAMGALTISSQGQRNESTVTVGRGVARILESRRHMMKRALEEHFARPICEHPGNKALFDHEPNIAFTPRNIQLDSEAQIVQAILALRTQNELSRESTLEYFGFDQAVEALRREIEEEEYDDIFQTKVPFDSPMNNGGDTGAEGDTGSRTDDPSSALTNKGGEDTAPQITGARGGRPTGGGRTAKSPQGVKKQSQNGNPSN